MAAVPILSVWVLAESMLAVAADPKVIALPVMVVPRTLMPLVVTSRYLVAPVLFWTPNNVPVIGVALSRTKTPLRVESSKSVSSVWDAP